MVRALWAAAMCLSVTPCIAREEYYPIVRHLRFWSLLFEAERNQHPLAPVVRDIVTGEAGPQPEWKLPMLVNGLRKKPLKATITAYSEVELGGSRTTRWGSRLRRGICAADPRYWGPGSVIWIGDPIRETVIVEDTGGAIKGPHRFDYCGVGNYEFCKWIGLRRGVTYVPLYRVPPGPWGTKPKGWHPPVWKIDVPTPMQRAQRTSEVGT